MTGKKGESITLSCRAAGTPTPSLTWYKDGVRLRPTSRIAIYDDVLEVVASSISSSQPLQYIAYTYTCLAYTVAFYSMSFT